MSRPDARAYQPNNSVGFVRAATTWGPAGRSRDRVLYDAVLQHFGAWRKALTASGINMANVSRRRPKRLDRGLMFLWLQQRQAAGKSVKWTAACSEDRDYALAIRRTFRSWRKASDAAGVFEAK